MDATLIIDLIKAHDKAIYWKQRCQLAEQYINETPCDYDITPLQLKAHNEYIEFIRTHKQPDASH